MTNIEAAKIFLTLLVKYPDLTGEEKLALRKAVKVLRRHSQNANHP